MAYKPIILTHPDGRCMNAAQWAKQPDIIKLDLSANVLRGRKRDLKWLDADTLTQPKGTKLAKIRNPRTGAVGYKCVKCGIKVPDKVPTIYGTCPKCSNKRYHIEWRRRQKAKNMSTAEFNRLLAKIEKEYLCKS